MYVYIHNRLVLTYEARNLIIIGQIHICAACVMGAMRG